MEVTRGNDAELSCSTGGIPIQYCRFISPNGKAYHLENEHTETGLEFVFPETSFYSFLIFSISYSGKGLNKGECGIKITNVNSSHDGNWTCITRLGYNNYRQNELSVVIQLDVSEPSSSVCEIQKILIFF